MKIRLNEDTSGAQNFTKLIKAITTGDITEAKRLITEMNNEEINAVDEVGNAALHYAASKGHKEICRLLLSMSPEIINATNNNGSTILHCAALGGHKEVCELLIPKMTLEAVNTVDKAGRTALHNAACGGHKEVCELLIYMSPEDINVVDKTGRTALHSAAFGGHKEVCELLIPKMSLKAINTISEDGNTALHSAAFGGHEEVCELLINKMCLYSQGFMGSMQNYWYGNPINVADKNGSTALHYAASKGHKGVCELLITKMNPEAINATDTALLLAAKSNHKETCKVLIGNMQVKEAVVLLNQSSDSSPIQKMIGEIGTDFINDKFLSNEINPTNFDAYQVKLLKLYHLIDQDLLKSCFNEEKSHSSCVSSVNKYIAKHYFMLIGVCKSVSEDNSIAMLVTSSDCMSHMLSYLAPHSLCPELFAPVPVGLLGETAGVNPENRNEREECIVS
jgi:ankyrin repeat protein